VEMRDVGNGLVIPVCQLHRHEGSTGILYPL
jgi:hypothetical protein